MCHGLESSTWETSSLKECLYSSVNPAAYSGLTIRNSDFFCPRKTSLSKTEIPFKDIPNCIVQATVSRLNCNWSFILKFQQVSAVLGIAPKQQTVLRDYAILEALVVVMVDLINACQVYPLNVCPGSLTASVVSRWLFKLFYKKDPGIYSTHSPLFQETYFCYWAIGFVVPCSNEI